MEIYAFSDSGKKIFWRCVSQVGAPLLLTSAVLSFQLTLFVALEHVVVLKEWEETR